MIKNHHLVIDAENRYLERSVTRPEKALRKVAEMYDFSRKYGFRSKISPEDSPHVQSLIKLSKRFSMLKTKKHD